MENKDYEPSRYHLDGSTTDSDWNYSNVTEDNDDTTNDSKSSVDSWNLDDESYTPGYKQRDQKLITDFFVKCEKYKK